MRLTILFALLLVAAPAMAQTAPRYHNSGAVDSPRYSSADYGATYARPLWEFRDYPNGVKPGASFYRYYPYSDFRSSYPADSYNRSKVQRYPVR